ncbi:MAG: amidohydrolase family protein [Acidimicrobiales bacterium]
MAEQEAEQEAELDWLVSVDDHVIEPPHVWESRLPRKFRELGPRYDRAAAVWRYEDIEIPILRGVVNGAVPVDQRRFAFLNIGYDEIPPACYDPKARVDAMMEDRVAASVLFPTVPRFCGQTFWEGDDRELGSLCVQAYNDWMLEEWCAAFPGRFIGNVLIPLWDPPGAADELLRCAELGARAFMFSENPHDLGLPSIHDVGGYWDPVFATAAETGMVLCTHLGSSSKPPTTSPDAPGMVSSILLQLIGVRTLTDWLFSTALDRYPGLRVCLSEGGVGWMPAVLGAVDAMSDTGARAGIIQPGDIERALADQDGRVLNDGMNAVRTALSGSGGPRRRTVRQVYDDQIFGCFIRDDHGARCIEEIGVDKVMVETDFPHNSTEYPASLDGLHRALAHLTRMDQEKVLRTNASRLFDFEPARLAR